MGMILHSEGQGERAKAGSELASENCKPNSVVLALAALLLFTSLAHSQTTVTPVVNYQGRVNVQKDGAEAAYTGAVGYFKFAIINVSGTITYWSNDGTSVDGGEPGSSITVAFPGGDGVFAVSLGGAAMTPLATATFADPNTLLRVWFSADDITFEELKPNERFGTVPYAFRARVADAVAPQALQPGQLSNQFTGMTLVSDDPDERAIGDLAQARRRRATVRGDWRAG